MSMDQILADIRRVLTDPGPHQRTGPLRDGGSVRVPMMVLDSAPHQSSRLQDATDLRDAALAERRRYLSTAYLLTSDGEAATEITTPGDARAAYLDHLNNAWRQ